MRISGQQLRTPIVLHPSLGNTGDGDAYGPDKPVNAKVKRRTTVVGDSEGSTLTVWATAQIRPTVRVLTGDDRRPPAAGDQVTIAGVRRTVESVEPVQGPGTAIVAYELTTGPG